MKTKFNLQVKLMEESTQISNHVARQSACAESVCRILNVLVLLVDVPDVLVLLVEVLVAAVPIIHVLKVLLVVVLAGAGRGTGLCACNTSGCV